MGNRDKLHLQIGHMTTSNTSQNRGFLALEVFIHSEGVTQFCIEDIFGRENATYVNSSDEKYEAIFIWHKCTAPPGRNLSVGEIDNGAIVIFETSVDTVRGGGHIEWTTKSYYGNQKLKCELR